MGRIIAAVVLVTTITGGIFYWNWYTQGEEYKKDKQQISDLQQQISTLEQQTNASKTENDQLKAEIAKVQAEQANLAVQNEILSKAIATYKSTGRMPDYKLPYPPK